MLRGPVLWPVGPRRAVHLADGVLSPEQPEPLPARRGDLRPTDPDGLIVPAFADWHLHWPQIGIAGRTEGPDGPRPLLDWLTAVAWPAEATISALHEPDLGAAAAAAAGRLRRAGTLAGAVYATPSSATAAAFLDAAPASFVCGPAVMTRGQPSGLVRGIDEQADGLEALVSRFGQRVAVAPRFAPSVDADALGRLGELARRHGLVVQTHLAETEDEVAIAARRFPGTSGYAGALRDAGLLGARTLLGHVVHAADPELAAVAESGALVVHCPTSNRDLRSGTMPLDRIRRSGVRWVLGSDVGAGPELCMLDAMSGALDAHPPGALTAVEAWHRATLGPLAVLTGRTEVDVSCGMRPGALVLDPPDGVARGETDPAVWLGALLDRWRTSRTLGLRRVLAW